MSTIPATLFGGTFNALAFTGFSFLFRKLDNNKYLEETKRHNLAMEKLQQAREKWFQNETRHKNRILELRAQVADAKADMEVTNKAFEELGRIRSVAFENRRWKREPRLEDFYKPSREMKNYALATAGVLGAVGGSLGYALFLS